MPDTSRRLGRTLGMLAMALLNATLILLALCLWLGWSLLAELRDLNAAIGDRMALLQPLRADVTDLSAEVAGLRADLAGLSSQSDASGATAALAGEVAGLDARIAGLAGQLRTLIDDPGPLIDRAVDRAAMQIKAGIAACRPGGA